MDDVDEMVDFERGLDRLNGREVLALGLRCDGLTNAQIADVFHVAPQRVSQIIGRAVERIREAMA